MAVVVAVRACGSVGDGDGGGAVLLVGLLVHATKPCRPAPCSHAAVVADVCRSAHGGNWHYSETCINFSGRCKCLLWRWDWEQGEKDLASSKGKELVDVLLHGLKPGERSGKCNTEGCFVRFF